MCSVVLMLIGEKARNVCERRKTRTTFYWPDATSNIKVETATIVGNIFKGSATQWTELPVVFFWKRTKAHLVLEKWNLKLLCWSNGCLCGWRQFIEVISQLNGLSRAHVFCTCFSWQTAPTGGPEIKWMLFSDGCRKIIFMLIASSWWEFSLVNRVSKLITTKTNGKTDCKALAKRTDK